MSTLDHNFNEIAASTAKPEAETSKYPPPFSIRLTFEERARLDADRGRASLAAHIREPEDARNRYFRDGSRMILRALMLHLATRGQTDLCTLPEMWRVVSSPRRLERAVEEMKGSEALFGMVADLGDDLAYQMKESAEQFADFRQGALQALDIFDPLGWLADAVSGNDVEFAKLKEGKTTVYLVIPQDKIATHGTWLGLVTRQAITEVARSQGNNEVLFMLD